MKLSFVIEGYWLDKQIVFSANTIKKNNYFFRMLTDYLGDVEFEAINANDIRRFLVHLRADRNLSKRTTFDAWVVLSGLWTWAGKEIGAEHIVRKVAKPTYPERKIVPYSVEEVRSLIKVVEYNAEYRSASGKLTRTRRATADRDRAIILVLLDTGIRASELCGLVVGDYDQKRGRLFIRHGKGDKSRIVVMGSRSQKGLWRYLSTRPDTKEDKRLPLFASKSDNSVDRNNLRHMLNRAAERAGVSNVHPHRFRHTFAINFLRNGGNVFTLKELLGHEKLETVMIYATIVEQDIDAGQKHSPADKWRL